MWCSVSCMPGREGRGVDGEREGGVNPIRYPQHTPYPRKALLYGVSPSRPGSSFSTTHHINAPSKVRIRFAPDLSSCSYFLDLFSSIKIPRRSQRCNLVVHATKQVLKPPAPRSRAGTKYPSGGLECIINRTAPESKATRIIFKSERVLVH